jgi:DNA-binding NarL/FixJ family response regulator
MVLSRLKKRIVIVDQNDKIREGVGFAIERNANYMLVNTYANCRDAVKQLLKDCPDLIIMDLIFSEDDGLEGIRMMKERYPFAEIMVYTDIDSIDVINDALSAGISAYIMKDIVFADFLHSVELVLSGGAVLSSKVTKKVISFFHVNPSTPLSDRETSVLKLITLGKTYSEIAIGLNISVETSKTHIRNIYRKLNVNSKSEAVRKALNERLIPVGSE